MNCDRTMPVPPDLTPPRLLRGLAAVGITGPAARWRSYQLAGYENTLSRWYLDAAKTTSQTSDWRTISAAPELVHQADARTARERAAYLVASTEYGHRAVEVLVDTTLGTGIKTQMTVKWSKVAKEAERLNNEAESAKERWAETAFTKPNMHLHEGQTLWLKATATDGQCFLYRRYIPNRKVRGLRGLKPAPALCYEILPASRLSDYLVTPEDGNLVVSGIEYDAEGQAVAFHFADDGYSYKTYRLPAENILHHYRVDRPGQRQGITWLAPVVQSLYILRDILEYKLIQYKVQSALSVLVSDETGAGMLPGLPTPAGASKTTNGGAQQQFLVPGMIHRVGQGKVTSFMPSPSGDLDPLTRLCLRGIGVGFGLSYERLSGDYNQVSFAGGRLTENALYDRVDVVHAWYCRGVELPLHQDWVDYATAVGDIATPPAKADPYASSFTRPRRRRGVNPLQEVKASIAAIDAGLSSHRIEMAEQGLDAAEVLEDIHRLKDTAKTDLQLAIAKALDIEALPVTDGTTGYE